MPRSVHADVLTEIQKANIVQCHILKGVFDGETLALTDTNFNISYGGITYIGAGGLVGVDTVEETPEAKVTEVSIGLIGLDQNVVSILENYNLVNAPIEISRVFLSTTPTLSIIGTPLLIFKGYSDGASLAPDGETVGIRLVAKDLFSDFDRTNGRRTNDAEHRKAYPTDQCFKLVASLKEKTILWQ